MKSEKAIKNVINTLFVTTIAGVAWQVGASYRRKREQNIRLVFEDICSYIEANDPLRPDVDKKALYELVYILMENLSEERISRLIKCKDTTIAEKMLVSRGEILLAELIMNDEGIIAAPDFLFGKRKEDYYDLADFVVYF